jgi:acyl-CoA synthetase (NDP forming)
MHTLAETAIPAFDLSAPESIARLLPEVARESDKPIIGVIDGGRLYDGLRDRLMAEGVPVFPVSDRAVAALAQYIQARLYADVLRGGLGG